MRPKFELIFLREALDFVKNLDEKDSRKILYNIDKAKYTNDPKLFKKLDGEIWEFRTRFNSLQYRLFAFWDKRNAKDILVIATHGIVKKTQKTAKKEIDKAEKIREKYFDNDNK